jgi:hypothetical protein
VAEAEQPGLRRQQQQQQAAGLGHVHLWGAGQPEQLRLRQWPQQEPQQEPQQQPQKQHAGVQPQQQSHQQLTPQLQTQARFQQQQQQRLSPAGLVMLSDAARRLKLDPPPEWQAAFAAAARQLTPVADARNLPLMLAPLVRWRLVPDPAWLQQHLAACMGVLDCMRPQVSRWQGNASGVASRPRASKLFGARACCSSCLQRCRQRHSSWTLLAPLQQQLACSIIHCPSQQRQSLLLQHTWCSSLQATLKGEIEASCS